MLAARAAAVPLSPSPAVSAIATSWLRSSTIGPPEASGTMAFNRIAPRSRGWPGAIRIGSPASSGEAGIVNRLYDPASEKRAPEVMRHG